MENIMANIMQNTEVTVVIMAITDITETRDIMPSTVSTTTPVMAEGTAQERRELEREVSTSRRLADQRRARTLQAAPGW